MLNIDGDYIVFLMMLAYTKALAPKLLLYPNMDCCIYDIYVEWKKYVVNAFLLLLDWLFVPCWQNELCSIVFYEFVLSHVFLCCDDLRYFFVLSESLFQLWPLRYLARCNVV